MRKIYIILMILGALAIGASFTNVPSMIKKAFAGYCECEDGCPCSHCSGKSSECNC